ncbi:MAG: UDP-2,3-diacylglucosamine diphosphatase [Flavobacteriaceae bacterium]
MKLPKDKKVFFASDQHFGAPTAEESKIREACFINWLASIENEASALFLLGDLFDFWFEYKKAVPKGFIRVLGKLAQLVDQGIGVYFFVGNHDLWMEDYFEKELGITVYKQPQDITIEGVNFYLGHGDCLGPDDKGFKRLKKVFTHPVAKRLFHAIHPDIGLRLGQYLSLRNKKLSGAQNPPYRGAEQEWLVHYARQKLQEQHRDFFLFGHRHLPLEIELTSQSKYINLGDWVHHFSYAVFDGKEIELKKWNTKDD